MGGDLVDVSNLSKVEETLFITLQARALDSRRRSSILGDTMSDRIAGQIDYDFDALRVTKEQYNCAIRAGELDECVRRFLARHRSAIAMDLGCGLDNRRLRVAPLEGIRWFDVDKPAVIELRRRFYSEDGGYTMVGVSLVDTAWLDAIPSDGPVVITLDGVLPFIGKDAVISLFRRLTEHFPSGQIAFNSYSTLAARLMQYTPAIKAIGVSATFGFDDAREPEGWAPGLRLAGESYLLDSPLAARMPRAFRLLGRVMSITPSAKREAGRILRYDF